MFCEDKVVNWSLFTKQAALLQYCKQRTVFFITRFPGIVEINTRQTAPQIFVGMIQLKIMIV